VTLSDALTALARAKADVATCLAELGMDPWIAEVARAHERTLDDLIGPRRAFSRARHEAWWVLHRQGFEGREIAARFGCSRSAVSMALDQMRDRLLGDAELRARLKWIGSTAVLERRTA
jgi:hypothetical protein